MVDCKDVSYTLVNSLRKCWLESKSGWNNACLFNVSARRAETKPNIWEIPVRDGVFWGWFWIWIWYDEFGKFWIYIQILYPFWKKDIYPDHISSNWIYILDIISLDIYPTQCCILSIRQHKVLFLMTWLAIPAVHDVDYNL